MGEFLKSQTAHRANCVGTRRVADWLLPVGNWRSGRSYRFRV